MKIGEALDAIKQDESVRRKDWYKGRSIRHGEICGLPVILSTNFEGKDSPWIPQYEDLMADDWIILRKERING